MFSHLEGQAVQVLKRLSGDKRFGGVGACISY